MIAIRFIVSKGLYKVNVSKEKNHPCTTQRWFMLCPKEGRRVILWRTAPELPHPGTGHPATSLLLKGLP